MNNENLSREEAAERSALISVDTYDVHVDLTNAKDPEFESYPTATTVRFSCNTPGAETFIDYIHHSIDSVKLNGVELKLDDVVDGARIRLANLKAENVLTIHGRSYYSRSGEGLHRYFDPSDGRVYLYTQYEPSDCRRVFPNFEQPDLKAVFNFRITAPKDWVVSSNAVLESQVTDPSDDSVSKRVFAPTAKISTYITAILAGEYFTATTTYKPKSKVNSGDIPLVTYCRQSLKPHFDYENIFKVTENGLDFFQDLFDYPYPYPKYEQAFVPEYNIGAMENPGLVTFTEDYIFVSGATEDDLEGRTNTICHEMAHMWFGDLVTMKWWDDLWLKESFADFMGTLGAKEANHFEDAWVTFANNRKAWAYMQDQLPTTHPIVADIPHLEAAAQNFDGITYAKGASVLKQLVAYVGFDTFIEAARVYFKRFEWGNTSLNDFLQVLNEVSGRDMQAWADAWLQTSGVSGLGTKRVYGEDGQLTDLILTQELPAQHPAELGRPHVAKLETFRLVDGKLVSTGVLSLEYPAERVAEHRVELTDEQKKLVGEADLLMLNAEDHTYAKVALTNEDGLQAAIEGVSTLESALSRGLIWGSLWENVRDARLPVTTYVDAVVRNVSKEPSASLLGTMVNNSQVAIATFSAPTGRERLYDALYDAFSAALAQAKPGSDEQLILLRGLISVSTNATKGEELCRDIARGAFEDTTGDIADATGIPYDQNLGWSALGALASRNLVTVDDLERASKYSPSSISSNGYAYAMAALPNAERKAAAYKTIMDDKSLSNDTLASTINGYVRGPVELREQYYGPYFDALLGVWESRSIGMASRIVRGLYPKAPYNTGSTEGLGVDDNPSVKLAQQWLEANPEAPSALRRLVLEAQDHGRRSILAQRFNASLQAQ
ncbi:aminopeptidase N [uncultured Rothia sp.]|uniref:aminopeptidase N n=1 Tax=uncultured Rothia sp. TaxID=316088 RepID=UPI0025F91EE1|nr:aminopeptidase N [uncultured Rothia sp.]